jgi:hypothetical protein
MGIHIPTGEKVAIKIFKGKHPFSSTNASIQILQYLHSLMKLTPFLKFLIDISFEL